MIEELLGKTLTSVEMEGKERILFTTTGGEVYQMFHHQDCCESVTVEDVVGHLTDLVGSPITIAEESTSSDPDKDTGTWTFYRLATVKGYVTIRWCGLSNGYYSEEVSFEKV